MNNEKGFKLCHPTHWPEMAYSGSASDDGSNRGRLREVGRDQTQQRVKRKREKKIMGACKGKKKMKLLPCVCKT